VPTSIPLENGDKNNYHLIKKYQIIFIITRDISLPGFYTPLGAWGCHKILANPFDSAFIVVSLRFIFNESFYSIVFDNGY